MPVENTLQGPESDPVEDAIETMLLRSSHLDLTILIHENVAEDTLREEAEARGFGSYPTDLMLDQVSFHDFTQIIRKHIPKETLYQEARWRGWAGPEED